MIPIRYINEWRQQAPWQNDAMVEQDLIICRALTNIFNNEFLAGTLAFRGGTALHKLFFKRNYRYSEDIDLVQIKAESIGATFDALRSVLDPWLGTPQRKLKEGRANLYYRYESEGASAIRMRLKIEINTREHFSIIPYEGIPFTLESEWHKESTTINSFHFNELIATKLRALYQRKKGRDLFDLWLATQHRLFNRNDVLKCFTEYMLKDEKKVSRAEFEKNLILKSQDPVFLTDIIPLLATEAEWDPDLAFNAIHKNLITMLPGEEWAEISNNEKTERITVQVA